MIVKVGNSRNHYKNLACPGTHSTKSGSTEDSKAIIPCNLIGRYIHIVRSGWTTLCEVEAYNFDIKQNPKQKDCFTYKTTDGKIWQVISGELRPYASEGDWNRVSSFPAS